MVVSFRSPVALKGCGVGMRLASAIRGQFRKRAPSIVDGQSANLRCAKWSATAEGGVQVLGCEGELLFIEV